MHDIKQIFLEYYRPLCIYALHYLKSMDEAEDIVEDCFVAFVDKLNKGEDVAAARPYLYNAVRNRCIDKLRRHCPVAKDILPEDLDGSISDGEAEERSFDEARLWTTIEQLPKRQREILLMSKRDGKTYKQIAVELNIAEKTVEHQLSRALKTLRLRKDDFLFSFFF